MPPVFGHGRLRLYLLKLLGEAPRHGYEVIRLLEERFQGLYAPSAGTVYPRLAKLESEGLVRHAEEGGRKVYTLTTEGEAELNARGEELTQLEREIRESLAALAAEIREDVSGSASALRQEVRRAAARAQAHATQAAGHRAAHAARQAEARRAREDSRRARREANRARREARQAAQRAQQASQHAGQEAGGEAGDGARDPFEQAARRIHERVQAHTARGDWHAAVREGLEGLSREFGGLGRLVDRPSAPWATWYHRPPADEAGHTEGHTEQDTAGHSDAADGAPPRTAARPTEAAGGDEPPEREEPVADPERELLRLLDRLRDDVRDAARDHGVTQEQFRACRRTLSETAAHLVAMLRSPGEPSHQPPGQP